jgi:hypothetical protein
MLFQGNQNKGEPMKCCAKRDEQEWCLTVYLETALTSLRKEFR